MSKQHPDWLFGAGTINGRCEDHDMEFLMDSCDTYMAGYVATPSARFWVVYKQRAPLLRRVLDLRFPAREESRWDDDLLEPDEIRKAASYLLSN